MQPSSTGCRPILVSRQTTRIYADGSLDRIVEISGRPDDPDETVDDDWLADKGVCYAPVLNLQEAWQQDYLRERGMIETGADGVERLGTPVRFRDEPGRPSDKLANLGEDTDALLERLGYDSAARRALHDDGVC